MQISDSSDILKVIRAIAGTATLAEVEAHADKPLSLRLEPGQDVRGEVLATLTNGRSLVKIGGDVLDMNLPSTVKPGEKVLLTYVGDKPRLTFALGQEGSKGSQVVVSDAGRWLTLLTGTPPGEDLAPEEVTRIITTTSKDAVLVAAQETTAPFPRLGLQPGQESRAQVLAEASQGRMQVKIADQLLEMNLPKTVRPGTTLDLMFVTDKPIPLFVMPQTPGPLSAGTTDIGRWLSFVSSVHKAEAPPPPPAPLLPGPADVPPTPLNQGLADRLRDALTRSGLFYESHVAEWAAGRTPTGLLLKEPQGQLSRPENADGGATFADSDNDMEASMSPGQHSSTKGSMAENRPLDLADQRTLHIVKQQLALLQTGQFVWQGEAWPGQKMEWTVNEREPEPEAGPERQWSTTLSVDTPRLGKITAELHMQGKRLQVTLKAEEGATAVNMKSNVQKLREGLSAAGLTLADLVISHDQQ